MSTVLSIVAVVIALASVCVSIAASRRQQTYRHQWDLRPEQVAGALREWERREQ